MTAGNATAALTGGVELLERAMSYTLGSLQLVTTGAMSQPTPCREWDLRALLRHMDDSLRTLHDGIVLGRVDLDPAQPGGSQADYGDPEVDPVASLRSRACAMVGAWANAREAGDVAIADRPLSSSIVAATGAVEVAVHGWDVARACGVDRPLPATLAEELLDLCPLLVSDADRAGRFGAPIELSRVADPSERLLAYLGRDPA
jgi:uncharacterized protein (TIGR03086 family)